jgi:hypothetical protein
MPNGCICSDAPVSVAGAILTCGDVASSTAVLNHPKGVSTLPLYFVNVNLRDPLPQKETGSVYSQIYSL